MTGLAERIAAGDMRALARAATWIEDRRSDAEALLKELFPRTGRALVLGVTGPPGAGKSTLVDQLIAALRGEGQKVAVLAVDPSSPFSGGAILGDRIRMQRHHADPLVFIRSMATRGWLGGLARSSTEMALLLDAAGFDTVIVETVGVGQGEVEIARLADVTLVVLVPGAGDDVQSIKAGIMEIAHVFVINKADLPGAGKLQQEIQAALSLSMETAPEIVQVIALEGKGVAELVTAVRACQGRGRDPERSARIWAARLKEMYRERITKHISGDEFLAAGREVAERRRDPYSVLDEWEQRV